MIVFLTAYDVAKLAAKPQPGKAGIEAFFTSKGNDVFAILPRGPGRSFQLNNETGINAITLLGSEEPVKFKTSGNSVSIDLPELPEQLLSQSAWV